MKKITIFTMQLKTPGGIEHFVSTLANLFADDFKVELVVNYGKSSEKPTFPLSSKVKITYLSPVQPAEISMKSLIESFKWHRIPGELVRRLKITRTRQKKFTRFLKNLTTDYLITDRALYNSLVSRLYRGEAVKIATDHNHHQNNKKYLKNLTRSLKKFTALVVATPELQNFYQNRFKNLKCFYIPNPLDSIPAKKSNLNTKNLLAIGRFVPEKDFSALIDVMAKVHALDPEIRLNLIGDGKEMPLLKSKIKTANLENVISSPGFLPSEKLKDYYYASSLFVLTSKTEAFGLVLTEAMSYGLPCVAFSRASGARAQISPKTGILIDHSNTDKMAKTIVELLNDRERLLSYQREIATAIEAYSSTQVRAAWLKLFDML